MAKNKKPVRTTTQEHLNILEIKDDCVILKDGSLVAIVMVSSINFSLKSADEQDAIIQAYINFLNSFHYPFQIVIHSRKLNIDAYLEKLTKIEREQENDLLRIQIAEYRNYVKELVKIGQIMTKRFFISLRYNPGDVGQRSFWQRIMDIFYAPSIIRLRREIFLKRHRELMDRVAEVRSALNSMGLNSALLDTQSLIELFYNIYNPTTSPQQPLPDLTKLNIEE